MAKTTARQSIRVSRYLGLGAAPVLTGIEAASQTFKKGAPLKNSSGSLAIGAVDEVAGWIGIAEHDAAGVTGTAVKMVPILANVVFCAELSELATGAYTLTQGDMYAKYALNVTTGGGAGKWYVDQDDTTNKNVLIVGFRDAVGTSNAIVEFVFLNAQGLWVS